MTNLNGDKPTVETIESLEVGETLPAIDPFHPERKNVFITRDPKIGLCILGGDDPNRLELCPLKPKDALEHVLTLWRSREEQEMSRRLVENGPY